MNPTAPPATVETALSSARASGLDRLDAQWLLASLLGRPRAWLLTHAESALSTEEERAWHDLLQRHAQGEPLAYLAGWTEFHGLRLQVTPAVLVPRSDTETLVNWALDALTACTVARPRVLDLGTGSGAIALAVKRSCPQAQVTAVDASAAALEVAMDNGRRLGLSVDWLQGDWWGPLDGAAPFDLVLSNPPYIAEDDPHLGALRHEPRAALAAGSDGLSDFRRILAGAPIHLSPGGSLLLEHGWTQAQDVAALLAGAGLERIETRADLAGRPRCTGGQWPDVTVRGGALRSTRSETSR
jgi:release factor glutamine methyltransferase